MELQIFENDEFGKIRTLLIDGEPWFIGKDIAEKLAYTNTAKAIRDHVDEEDKLIERIVLSGQKRSIICINESGLYSLILSSKLPTAKKFKRWLVGTVLPTIRKTGAYITPQTLSEVMAHPEKASHLFYELKLLQDSMEEMRPKAEYYNALVDCNALTNIRQTAKELRIPERLFTYLLEDMGFAYRSNRKILLPYAFMVTSGFAELKEYTNGKHGGVYMLFTPVGRLYLKRKIDKRLARKAQGDTQETEE
ncbi:MAG: BRO family protein [Oscillospiraceae bacterium]|nr:BRO family protein [Oscillospiraceae bacterium]HBR01495.1 hypothetical protein [Ruminiclostridium sp.]